MKNSVADRIRKRRLNQSYTQANMGEELGLSASAYNKIETGETSPSVKRIEQIAKILEVEPAYFFQDETTPKAVENTNPPYGFATKKDIEELLAIINKIRQELAEVKAGQKETTKKKK